MMRAPFEPSEPGVVESTDRSERADHNESADRGERASSSESTVRAERAESHESTVHKERAMKDPNSVSPNWGDITEEVGLDPVAKLQREVRKVAAGMPREAARGLVDIYYRWQIHRITLNNQVRTLGAAGQPTDVLRHFAAQAAELEKQVAAALGTWVEDRPEGRWAMGVKGIGPVLAAGLSAHIDIEKAPTVGHIWRFGGYDPTVIWGRGEKRPWNADLKVIFWKIGHSFVMVSGREGAWYGKVYRARKEQEVMHNEAGLFADQARKALETRKIVDEGLRKCYESGKLPPGRLDLRARRYAVKLFISHWHEYARISAGLSVPLPYPIAHQGHAHYVAPPK